MKTRLLFYSYLLTVAYLFVNACGTSKHTVDQSYINKYMTKQYEEIIHEIPDATVQLLKDTIKVIFDKGVLFKSSSAEISDSNLLQRFHTFANVLNKYTDTKILINGHTDSSGGEKLNFQLSLERAMQAKRILVNEKVVPARLFTNGVGSKEPLATNETAKGRAKNRRIEFIILFQLNH